MTWMSESKCMPPGTCAYLGALTPRMTCTRARRLICRICCAGVSQIDRVVEAVSETLKGNRVQMLMKKSLPRLDLPKVAV